MILNHVTRAILLLALAFVVQRGLYRRCWTFAANLVAVIVCGFLMAAWPATFYTSTFYGGTRYLYAGLKLLIALEVGYYVFRAFPRALVVARMGSLWILLILAVAVAGGAPWIGFQAWEFSRASFNAATVWLFGGMALLVVWYNLPLDRWHGTIMGGYTAYLLLSTLLLWRESVWRQYAMVLDPCLACWWAYAAWSWDRVKETKAVMEAARA